MDTYVSQQKNQLLDSLENQVHFSQLVAVIVGAKGVGKSFLLDQLQLRIEKDVAVARIDASLAMTVKQLGQAISLQLGLSWDDAQISLEKRVENELEHKAFIAIDDAHLLSEDCLNYILKLNQNQLKLSEAVMFIMLVGDELLPNMIENTSVFSLHQEMCVVLKVEPYQQNETRSLIVSCGHCDLDHLDELFDEKQLKLFWQYSQGYPGELDYQVSRWLQETNPIKQVELEAPAKGSMAKSFFYVILVVILSSVLVYQDEINQWISQSSEQTLAAEDNAKLKQKAKTMKKDDLSPSSNQQASNNQASAQQQTGDQVTQETETHRLEQRNQSQERSANQSSRPEKQAIADKGTTDKSEEPAKNTLAEPAQLPQVTPSETETVKPVAKSLQPSIDETWLLDQSPSSFSLQWVGLSQRQSAEEFITSHPLASEMKLYRRMTNGKPLFLVVSGSYASRELASNAIKGYKQRGFSGSPWAKSMAAIQREIKAFQSLQR